MILLSVDKIAKTLMTHSHQITDVPSHASGIQDLLWRKPISSCRQWIIRAINLRTIVDVNNDSCYKYYNNNESSVHWNTAHIVYLYWIFHIIFMIHTPTETFFNTVQSAKIASCVRSSLPGFLTCPWSYSALFVLQSCFVCYWKGSHSWSEDRQVKTNINKYAVSI